MRMLDLYCGEGLAAWGYWSSGRFSEIVGVDIAGEKRRCYSFDFIQGDALALAYDFLMDFDFIHASPPCQAYSTMTPKETRHKHMRLIAATHLMLHSAGKPFVIENVPGAKRELRPNCEMNGLYFGLLSNRPRYFYVSGFDQTRRMVKAGRGVRVHGGDYVARETLIDAFGLKTIMSGSALSKVTCEGIEQGIPPAFTRAIAEMLFPEKFLIG